MQTVNLKPPHKLSCYGTTGYVMATVGNVCHVFTKIVFVHLKHGVALDHICQDSTFMKLSKVSDQKLSPSLASVVPLVHINRERAL